MAANRPKWTGIVKTSTRVALLATAAACGPHIAHAQAATCEDLSSARLPNTKITAAQSIAAGSYQPPGSTVTYTNLPAFCRVTATISPVPGSAIGIEVWLPTTTWNHKYQQSGNHGFGGSFYWGEMVRQIQRGYATGITDDGHTMPADHFSGSWAIGVPEKITDLAWRGVHELADKAKLIIKTYYGQPQTYAYFNGCSDGGREAMKEAQMFPRDFNGIIASGSAQHYTHAAVEQLYESLQYQRAGITGDAGAAILKLVQNAETAACDKMDGVADGLIRDPRRCHFDPSTLVCKAGQDPSTCITQAQAEAVRASEASLRDPVTGQEIYSGQAPGSEFDQLRFGHNKGPSAFGIGNFQIAYQNLNWDVTTFDLHKDVPRLDAVLGSVNAIDSDLRRFKAAGGKLIQWHGWDDAAFSPGWTVSYYDQVVRRVGGGNVRRVQDFYRLFMLPGVGHCGTGIGPDNIGGENQTAVSSDPEHDVVSALEAWVERHTPPDLLIATRPANGSGGVQRDAAPELRVAGPVSGSGVQMQRPICPYPEEAVYKGDGDTNAASSFTCANPNQSITASRRG